MNERRKLSLGAVAERAGGSTANRTRGWNVSPARAAARQQRGPGQHGQNGRTQRHPTLPSRLMPSSFCASTANSIGSC